MEDVHDHLQVIEHDPLAGWKAIHSYRPRVVLLFQLHFNFIRDRFDLRFRLRRADDKKIRESGDVAQIEDNDVFRFFVRREFGASAG